MDCCSSNYMDYRHSINNNFCYPYSPSMMRSASPYQLPPGAAGRYGAADYRGGYYDGSFDKYYGSYHHPGVGSGHGGGYGGNYYGNSYSSYREFAYNDYYHPSSVSPSSHPFAGPPHPGSFHGPHMFSRHQSLPLPFQRESYYHQRDHHQYAAGFSNYSGNPYKGPDSNPGSSSTTSSGTGNNAPNGGGSRSPGSTTPASESPLFGAKQNAEYTHSPDYSAQSYNSSSSPNHPHHHRHHPHLSPGEAGGGNNTSSSSSSSYPPSAMPNATGTYPMYMKNTLLHIIRPTANTWASENFDT